MAGFERAVLQLYYTKLKMLENVIEYIFGSFLGMVYFLFDLKSEIYWFSSEPMCVKLILLVLN